MEAKSSLSQPMLRTIALSITRDAALRARRMSGALQGFPLLVVSRFPSSRAQSEPFTVAPPNTAYFTPTAVPPNATWIPDHPSIQKDVDQQLGWFYMNAWDERGRLIRAGSGSLARELCLGNLSIALQQLGALRQAEYSGAAGALSLLPTAGALIGSPTKELWVVYKLVPLAGFLSMCLSLGGTMVPTQAGAYDPKKSFTYDGLIATADSVRRARQEIDEPKMENMDPCDSLARRVQNRAEDDRGGSYGTVWIGILIQVFLIVVIMIALYYGQVGGVIVWWCSMWGYMWFWYALVVIISVFENSAGMPFTHNWTLRVAKAPSTIRISEDAPEVSGREQDILAALKSGFNVSSSVTMANDEPYSTRKSCFYVVISQEEVSAVHALLRVISKGSSVAVFAFGTTLFASVSLMSVSVVLMILGLVLSSGVWGRVTALWIASEMNKINDPILHVVVSDRQEAAKHMDAILKIPGLIFEVSGHVIINQRVIRRRSTWLCAATYIGLLAPPFNVAKVAVRTTGIHSSDAESSSLTAYGPK